jgi:hypothetical protein
MRWQHGKNRTGNAIASYIEGNCPIAITESHLGSYDPVRVAFGAHDQIEVGAGRRLKGDNSPRIASSPQLGGKLAGIGADVKYRIDLVDDNLPN